MSFPHFAQKQLHEVNREDLEALVTGQVHEGRTLDYKEEILLAKDGDKLDLVRDVSSFANATGGDIIFGAQEAKDADGKNLGYPAQMVGVDCNYDDVKLRFESIVRDNIDPPIQGIQFHKVERFERGPVVIVRIPRSWNGPHMVAFQKKTQFYSRNNSGKHALERIRQPREVGK